MPRNDRAHAAPGIAEIRLSGAAQDTAALVSVLERLAAGLPVATVALEIITRSAPYANRRDPGERVYLTVRIGARRDHDVNGVASNEGAR